MPVQPIGHHDLVMLLTQLALLLLAARVCGELARKMSLPAVVGELMGGVLLGPSVFGALAPGLQSSVFPVSQQLSDLLSVVTWLGVIFLLLVTGLETDLALVRRQGRRAVSISLGGIIVPFATGIALGYYLPESMLGKEGARFVFVLFVATAMSISAIPVIARVLMEMKLIRRDIGQLTLAAGMIDDTIGWLLLSVVAGLAASGVIDWAQSAQSIAALGILLTAAFTVGRRAVSLLVRWVDDYSDGADGVSSLIVVLTLLAGALTLFIGLEAVLGAFLIGILLREAPRFRPEAAHALEDMTRLVFAPIFFASAGLKVDMAIFADSATLPWALLVLGVACFGKFAGAYLGARAVKLGNWEALSMGAGLNARGAMEIIVATIGLSLGVIAQGMYSIIVMVAIVTSLIAPPILRVTLRKVKMGPEEAERLQREERENASFWSGVRRVFLPTRGGANILVAATLLRNALSGTSAEVTVVSLRPKWNWRRFWELRREPDITASAVKTASAALEPLPVRGKIVSPGNRAVANELLGLARDHDLVVIGASQDTVLENPDYTFSKVTDEILQGLQVPGLVVSAPGGFYIQTNQDVVGKAFRKILVPTSGTKTSRVVADLGMRLSEQTGAEVTFLFVDELDEESETGPMTVTAPVHPLLGMSMIAESPRTHLMTVRSPRAGEAVAKVANEEGFDLIVVGAKIRTGTRRAYLGPDVDMILHKARCTVAVFVRK